ncbi:MAG: cysteine desulfurase family protein [Verrucomicrobia bacterium]|nr:cysteine desulfurase family protein [Verrucomicrobiota bacterium]MDA1087629.1 cysteine desulfurase family protein [Verrucomicrobiota bacterium]
MNCFEPTDMIYLDNNATTPIASEVRSEMEPFLGAECGNPSSLHAAGIRARAAVEQARSSVAQLIGASSSEIVFTGCGTEGNNLALCGTLARSPELRLVLSRVEHPSVLEVGKWWASRGGDVTWIGVDRQGRLNAEALEAALDGPRALVSLMWANNETGVLFDIPRIAECVKQHGGIFHTDAVQAAARVALDVGAVPVDLLAIAGHKMHAPKGVGALYVRRGVKLDPLFLGGGQEQGLRGGTENVASIVGLGKAADLIRDDFPETVARISGMRDGFERDLCERCSRVVINGTEAQRLCNTSHISIADQEAESTMLQLSDMGIAVATGSACATGSIKTSHVLRAMNMEDRMARGSLRVSLGRYTTETELDQTVDALQELVSRS